jgi:hypothetical protein
MSRLITLERATEIEPAFLTWEADVLPLRYIRRPSHDWVAPDAAAQRARRDMVMGDVIAIEVNAGNRRL